MENKVKIKLNVEYIKRTTIFVFKFLFFTIFIIYIDNLKLTLITSLIDILVIGFFSGI